MKWPKITPDNFDAVLDWFAKNGQQPRFAKFGHELMAHVVSRPNLTDDAGAGPAIRSLTATGTRLIMVSNHPSKRDPRVIPAVAPLYEPLKGTMGNTKIMAAAMLFTEPGIKGWLQAQAMVRLGAYPVINTELYPDITDEQRTHIRQLHTRHSRQLLIDGWNLVTFVEGDKARGEDPTIVRPVKPGLDYIVKGLPKHVMAAVVPMGIHYPPDEQPRVHIAMPQPVGAFQDMRPELQQMLQAATDSAMAG